MGQSAFVIPILDPERYGVRGMRSSVNPATLRPGEFADLVNVRLSSGTLKVRPGVSRVGTTPQACPADHCLAAWGGMSNGSYHLLSAWSFGSVGRIYSYNITTGAWSEITAGSGAFGSTRMTAAGGPWSFATVRNRLTGREIILIQNGSDAPRAYDPVGSVSTTEKVAIHQTIAVPTTETGFVSTPKFPTYFNLQSSSTTSTASGANFTLTATGTAPDRYFELNRNTTAATGPTVTIQNATNLDLSQSRQLIFLTEGGLSSQWLHIKVEVLTPAGAAATVWDPTDGVVNPSGMTLVPDLVGTSRQWVALGLDAVDSAVRASINRVRLTWVGPTPSTTQTTKLYLIAGSGKVLGLALHCLSYANETSGAESPGTCITQIRPALVRSLGGPTLNQLAIIHSPLLYYAFEITYLNPSTTERDLGTQSLLIYRNDIGEPEAKYTYVAKLTLASYSGGWSFTSGTALSPLVWLDNTPNVEKYFDIESPDGYQEVVPVGLCMLSANGRLFVGAKTGDTIFSPQNSHLWVSDADNPLRFRSVPNSESSGTRLSLDSEYPTALAFSSTSAYGENSIWFITTRRTYRLGGYTTSGLSVMRLALPHGSYHSGSVQEDGGDLYMLTTENKLLRIRGGSVEFISDMQVEDRLSGTYTAPWNATSAMANRRYTIGIDNSGSISATSKQLLHYETRPSAQGSEFGWSRDQYGAGLGISFLVWHPQRTYGIGSDKYVYWVDDPGATDDQGNAILAEVRSREVFLPDRRGITVRSVRTLTDQASGGSVVHTATYRPSGLTQSATVALSASSAQSWVDSGVLQGSGSGSFHGVGVKLESSFTLPGQSEIFSIEIVAEQSDLEAETL